MGRPQLQKVTLALLLSWWLLLKIWMHSAALSTDVLGWDAVGNPIAAQVFKGLRRSGWSWVFCANVSRVWGLARSHSCRYHIYFASEASLGWGIEETSKINLSVIFLLPTVSLGREWLDLSSTCPRKICTFWKAPTVRMKLVSCCTSPSFHFPIALMQQTWSFPKQWPIVWFGWFSYLLNIMLFHLWGNRLDTSTRVELALCCCFNRQIKAAIFPV